MRRQNKVVKARLGNAVIKSFYDDAGKNTVFYLGQQIKIKASGHHISHKIVFEESYKVLGKFLTVVINGFFFREGDKTLAPAVTDVFHLFKNLYTFRKGNRAVAAEHIRMINLALKFGSREKNG